MFFSKKKEYEQRISDLELELSNFKKKHEIEIEKEREEKEELKTRITEIQQKAEEEKARHESELKETTMHYEEIISSEKERSKAEIEEEIERSKLALDDEKRHSKDALIAMREHIYAETNELNKYSEKDLMVRTILALSGFGTRLDRVESQYKSIVEKVNAEMETILKNESEKVLSDFRNANDQIQQTIVSISGQSITKYQEKTDEIIQSFSDNSMQLKTSINNSFDGFNSIVSNTGNEIKKLGDSVVKSVNGVIYPYENTLLNKQINKILDLVQYLNANFDGDTIDNINDTVQAINDAVCGDDSDGIKNALESVSDAINDLKESVCGTGYHFDNLFDTAENIEHTVDDIQSTVNDIQSTVDNMSSSDDYS